MVKIVSRNRSTPAEAANTGAKISVRLTPTANGLTSACVILCVATQ